jgi:hypothetical protein
VNLFDSLHRDYPGPRKHSQPSFEFLNLSSRPAAEEIRRVLDGWAHRFPSEGKADLIGRFRSADDAQHYGALLEMYCCELLSAHGFHVESHPTTSSGKSTHPDFLVSKDGTPSCYFECTLAPDPLSDPAEQARKNTVMDALNRVDPGPFIVTMEFGAVGATSPRVSRLRHEVEDWLRSLVKGDQSGLTTPPDSHSSRTWSLDGWTMTFTAYKSTWAAKTPGRRGIAGHMEGMRYVDSSGRLRRALSQKANRYGTDLGLPYLIAVNSLDDILEDYDVMAALFGEMRYATDVRSGESREQRAPTGLWRGSSGFQYGRMSGVLIINNLVPWTIWSATSKLWHHPKASYPLHPTDWRMPQMLFDREHDTMVERSGEPGAAILRLERPQDPRV